MARAFGVDVRGVSKLLRNMRRVSRSLAITATERGLTSAGNTIMREAKRETPVDRGWLRASGTVHPPQRRGRKVSVELAFGGGPVDYAIHVHENTRARHRVGKAKFLEDPVKRRKDLPAKRILREARKELRRIARSVPK